MNEFVSSRSEVAVPDPALADPIPPATPVRPLGRTRRNNWLPVLSALLFLCGAVLGLAGLLTGFGLLSRLATLTGMMGIGGFVLVSVARSRK